MKFCAARVPATDSLFEPVAAECSRLELVQSVHVHAQWKISASAKSNLMRQVDADAAAMAMLTTGFPHPTNVSTFYQGPKFEPPQLL